MAAATASFAAGCSFFASLLSSVAALLSIVFCISVDFLRHLRTELLDKLLCRRLKELLDKLLCRRFKERRHCFDIAMEDAALRDGRLAHAFLLPCDPCPVPIVSLFIKRYKSGGNFYRNNIFAGDRYSVMHKNILAECLLYSAADFAGAEQCIKEGKAKTSAPWVAATAAPHHATGNRDLLSRFIIEHDDQFVHAVDGIPRKVLARGAVITDSLVLPDVWYVPGLTVNLVSVGQLVELDYNVGFSSGECCIAGIDGKVVGKGHLQKGGLYVLDFLKVPLAI